MVYLKKKRYFCIRIHMRYKMKKTILALSVISILSGAFAASASGSFAVTPRPVETRSAGEGCFIFSDTIPLIVDAPPVDRRRIVGYAADNLPVMSAYEVPAGPYIRMSIAEGFGDEAEGYRLSVRPDSITVSASSGAGLFYGLQTLLQLVGADRRVASVDIVDFPRLEYRGVLLDISRHFRDKEFVKKQIDAMARLKMNRLHLHMTDAAGWRIEINRYPELTEYAAWRPQTTWKEWNTADVRYTRHDDPLAHGGYLTQADAAEIVSYAADRYITVVPEIEMPSHSEEVTAAYQHLACSPGWQPDLCIGNPATLEFVKNVLDEIMEIFPSEYIHIGGDEASGAAWMTCPKCQGLMKREGLSDRHELQSYLIRSVEEYLRSKGRRLIGWDEIMSGNPPSSDAAITLWRGEEIGIAAAKSGHKVISSPYFYCYLDNYQDAPTTQPEAITGYTPLEKVYGYDPVPADVSEDVAANFVGIQGNLWCEYIPTAQHAEYMLYPRVFAIAEIGWSPREARRWEDFRQRAQIMGDRLQSLGYTVFDLRGEEGQRREALVDVEHKALGKPVEYLVPWWPKYNAAFATTLTDGKRGGWTYSDNRWQGYMSDTEERLDVVVDLEKVEDISYIGADFMQLIGPDVWYPENVEISISDDGVNFTRVKEISTPHSASAGLSFKTYAWEGNARARYVRYRATSSTGCVFTDEIIVR